MTDQEDDYSEDEFHVHDCPECGVYEECYRDDCENIEECADCQLTQVRAQLSFAEERIAATEAGARQLWLASNDMRDRAEKAEAENECLRLMQNGDKIDKG